MNIDLDDAHALIALAEAGSISQAACDLRLTQPAVTRRIQRLEQAVGASLVDRRNRPFMLTELGNAAVGHCRRLVSTANELKAMAASDDAPMRELRIGVAHALTELSLFNPIEALRRKHPAIALRLFTGWSRDLVDRLGRNAIDAAIVLLPKNEPLPSNIVRRELADEKLEIIAPKKWQSRRWTVRSVGESNWILNPDGCAARAWLQKKLAESGMPLRVGVEAYNYDLQMSLVARGEGLGFVPIQLLARSAVRKQLCALQVRGMRHSLTINLLSGAMTPSLEAPLKSLRDALTEAP